MEATSHLSDIPERGASKNTNQSECVSSQPKANGTLPRINAEEAPSPLSDRSEDGDFSDNSLMGGSSTNDVSWLPPSHHNSSAPHKQKGVGTSSMSPGPICAPPPPSTCNRHNCSLHHPPHPHHPHQQRHQSTNQNRLSSTKSYASFKSDAAHIKEVAGDDSCVHCILACLFCEMLSMCSALGDCLACGVGGAECCSPVPCCCSVEAAGEAACAEGVCQAVLGCGILEDCCASSDCLEVCLECCSICFPS